MSWHTSRLTGFDLESTGTNPEIDRIVTACVVDCDGGQPTTTGTWLSDVDGVEIPQEATRVHRVTTERAHANGQPAAKVIQEVVYALADAAEAGHPVVIMNAPYDLTMLDREARRHGITPLTDAVGGQLRVIDPRVLDKRIDPFRAGRRTLTDLCAHYKVRLDGAHTADADAIAACRVAQRIGQQQPELAALSVDELHARQTTWAAEQARDLRAYFARTPNKQHRAAGVREDWPLIPFKETADVRP
ncbi:MAG TPA: exonuclease domain-containing protein [Streptomyces sp.]|nr:exonuclease domain-containing protein [Streptomyces sp.]